MGRKFCLAFLLVFAAAVIVQCETKIEVDENGDEYEVKRFNIQGRNLNEGRSQCVESRRKRSTSASTENGSSQKKNGAVENTEIYTSPTAPATGVETATSVDEVDEDEDPDLVGLMEESGNDDGTQAAVFGGPAKPKPVAVAVFGGGNKEDGDEDEEEEEEQMGGAGMMGMSGNSEEEQEEQNLLQLLPNGENGNTNNIPLLVEQPEDSNDIVLVQSHTPPKVNPQTHAVFELFPVNPAILAGDDDEDLHYEEEIEPVTTTAIWSTGDDGPLSETEIPLRRPTKKPRRKPTRSPNRKPSKDKTKNKRKNKRGQKKKGNKRPNSVNRRPTKKSKRRRPVRKGTSNKHKTSSSSNNSNSNRNSVYNKNKNHRKNSNKSNRNTKRKMKNDRNIRDKGTKTFTKTLTMTQTGTANDDKDVNCIIIRKDPPPTTPRPFWNILGRDAGDGPPMGHPSGQFGKRKRVNNRF